jgi:hypothetical protein
LAAVGRCLASIQKPCVDHAGLFILRTDSVGEGKPTFSGAAAALLSGRVDPVVEPRLSHTIRSSHGKERLDRRVLYCVFLREQHVGQAAAHSIQKVIRRTWVRLYLAILRRTDRHALLAHKP